MNIAGTLHYDTKLDTKGFQKGMGTVKDIVAGIGITKIIGKAVDVLTDSLDGAIKRVDTLNNYPKVMESLGYSTVKANKSIKKLSDGIEGLPTTLDEIVNNSQRLTASLGDLDKGTETAIALNDMFLAGGQGADAANRAFEQYNQIIAKGKVDQQSWNTLVEVAPGQMNQLAKSLLGAEANQRDLYQALQDGAISMEDFNNQVIKLDKEGGESFSSFREQAENATGGIETSLSNLRTAVVKGVANMINKVNEELENQGLPSIQEMLDMLKKRINEIFDFVIKNAPTAIKTIKTAVDLVEKMIPYLATIGGLILAWKIGQTVQKAVQAFQMMRVSLSLLKLETQSATVVQALFTKAQQLGAAAQAALNAVMAANPIALIVLAVIALIAIFVVLWKKCDKFREFWIKLWEGIKKVVKVAIDWVKENWKILLLALVNPFAALFAYLYKTNPKFREWVNKVIDIIKGLPKKIINIGKNIATGLWEGIKSMTSWLYEKIKGWVGKPIKWAKKILKIKSPSRVWRDEIGQWLPKGLAVGIEANTDSVTKAIDNMNEEMLSKMRSAVNLEAGKMNASAMLRSNANFNSIIQVNNELTSDVYLDKQKVGQAITPVVSKTLKTAGVR